MSRSTVSTRTTRLLAAGAVAVLALTGTAGVAAAHEGGVPARTGKACMMSGMVDSHDGTTRVCTKDAKGKLTWGKPLTSTATLPARVSGSWAKAATKGGMSAAFGMVKNTSSKPVTIVAASTPYAAAVQLHEVVMKDGAMAMQEKSGGFTIPAGGTLELKPGGNHLMFMGIKKAIKPGKMIPITLIGSDGSMTTVKVMGKVFAGANEEYDGGHSDTPMDGMGR